MGKDLQTFGEFLTSILHRKNLTITQLANITGMKSRNSIQRLLRDENSIELIENYSTKLTHINESWLTSSEIREMEAAIEVSRYGKSTISSRDTLLHLCFSKPNASIYNKNPAFSPIENPPSSIHELFQSYLKCQKLSFIIFDSPYNELTDAIKSLTTVIKIPIRIEHMIYAKDDAATNAEIFSSIYKLINYKNYNAYYSSSDCKGIQNDMSNLMVINKITSDKTHATDLIKVGRNRQYTILYSNPGDELYYFYLNYFNGQKACSLPLRRCYRNCDPIDKLIELCEFLLYLEQSSSEYLIKQNMCFQMIHTDISYQMLKDANFLGLGEDHPKIKKLVQVCIERFENYYTVKKNKICIFTKRGLEDFVRTHNLSDHFYKFRDFTDAEVKFTLEFILNQIRTNDYFKLYLMKDDYKIDNIEYSYYENQVIYLFDSCSGYDDDLDEGIIAAKPFLEIFDDFIKNELIPKHTYPEDETIRFLEYLIACVGQ
jgi:transcriptional regulator with XRE-family HTH domain